MKCSFPNCKGNVLPTVSGKVQLCPKHYEMGDFIVWFVSSLKQESEKQQEPKKE